MKKSKTVNVRPDRDTCLKCPDHGICEAETGNDSYMCPFIMNKKYRENI